MIEDEMVGWYHRLSGHEFEQAPEDGGQGSLACCSPWACKEMDMIEPLNNNNDTIIQNSFTALKSPHQTILNFVILLKQFKIYLK